MFLTKLSAQNRTVDYQDLSDAELEFELFKKDITLEISWLLNTISPQLDNNLHVLNYGIPDFVHLSPSSTRDTAYLKHEILLSIRKFEHRLKNVSVDVSPSKKTKNRLDIFVQGMVEISGVYKEFSALFGI